MSRPPLFWLHHEAARETLDYTYTLTPIVLMAVFLVSFFWQSIALSGITSEPTILGPGGRRLPQRNKKPTPAVKFECSPATRLVTIWLSVVVVLTYLAQAAIVIIYAVIHREEEWWCGKEAVVRTRYNLMTSCNARAAPAPAQHRPRHMQRSRKIIGMGKQALTLFCIILDLYCRHVLRLLPHSHLAPRYQTFPNICPIRTMARHHSSRTGPAQCVIEHLREPPPRTEGQRSERRRAARTHHWARDCRSRCLFDARVGIVYDVNIVCDIASPA